MAVLAIAMFVGITLLAHAYQVVPNERRDRSSRSSARGIFGGRGVAYYLLQAGDDADPRARGEHGLRRLPAAGVDRRRATATCRASS